MGLQAEMHKISGLLFSDSNVALAWVTAEKDTFAGVPSLGV